MKRLGIIIIVLIALAIGAVWWFASVRVAQAPTEQACTEDAKICLDGSAVGRTGPNCEFAVCPEDSATSTTSGGNGGGGSIVAFKSGVRGTVSLGPTCPVERDPPDPACADRPYTTAIAVYRKGSSAPFIIGNSDSSGAFEFSLSPGAYTLKATNGETLPRCADVSATVAPDAYTAITISCDTGIR